MSARWWLRLAVVTLVAALHLACVRMHHRAVRYQLDSERYPRSAACWADCRASTGSALRACAHACEGMERAVGLACAPAPPGAPLWCFLADETYSRPTAAGIVIVTLVTTIAIAAAVALATFEPSF